MTGTFIALSLLSTGIKENIVKVIIDRSTCVSCGSCWDACPGLFEQDPDDSFSRIIEKYRISGNIAEGMPSEDLTSCAQESSDLCPVQIISISD
jgi:ferredoxin